MTGIALRCEEPLYLVLSARLDSETGTRVPAGGAIVQRTDGTVVYAERSCLFFPDYDGLEYLTAPSPEALSVATVQALLDAPPQTTDSCRGRLIYDVSWYFAALTASDTALSAPAFCRIRFAGSQES